MSRGPKRNNLTESKYFWGNMQNWSVSAVQVVAQLINLVALFRKVAVQDLCSNVVYIWITVLKSSSQIRIALK